MNWADEQIKTGKVTTSDKRGILLETFAKEFWDWDKSPYVKGKLARGQRIGRTHVLKSAGYIEQHVLPYFKDRTLASIKPRDIESWLLSLREMASLKARSVNLVYMAFRTVLKEAHRFGVIPSDPTASIRMLAEEKTERGVLSIAEVKKLFASDTLEQVWKGDIRIFTANLLAASTGMREGEIRGLCIKYVFDDYIDVKLSWEQGFGPKEAKWGSVRCVAVPKVVAELLRKLIAMSPYQEPDDFVFYGERREVPLHARFFVDALYAALEAIEITKEQRKARQITFHSWRHFLNSISRGRVPDEKLRLMTGHRTAEMTDHYTHLLEEDYAEIRKVQEDVFGRRTEAEL